MKPRQVMLVGIGQCISWGILYYAFGVLLLPVSKELGIEPWQLTAAFSLALLASAIAAPTIGSLADRGRGPAVMQAGGLIAAVLLVGWAWMPSIPFSFLAWTSLGVCMAAILYEPTFTIVGRAIQDGNQRIRAIATITVWGGLASTIFLPLTAWLVDEAGWRRTVYILAVLLAVATLAVRVFAFDHLVKSARQEPQQASNPPSGKLIRALMLAFSCTSLASAGLAINLVPALVERGFTSSSAAWLAGLFGVMQLPGRLLVMRGQFTLSAVQLLWSSLALQVVGLIALGLLSTTPSLAIGVALFAAGSGMATIARPYLVLESYGSEQSGYVNGVIARAQQLTRAAGPAAAAFLATLIGYGSVFVSLAALLLVAGLALSFTPYSKA